MNNNNSEHFHIFIHWIFFHFLSVSIFHFNINSSVNSKDGQSIVPWVTKRITSTKFIFSVVGAPRVAPPTPRGGEDLLSGGQGKSRKEEQILSGWLLAFLTRVFGLNQPIQNTSNDKSGKRISSRSTHALSLQS